jgi:outer membrane protein assembly factor BamD (BamD/ComL family)
MGWTHMLKQGKRPRATPCAAYLILMGALISSFSCSLLGRQGRSHPLLQEDFSLLAPEEFPPKIKQLEDISQNEANASLRARALFYLALAHMHYRNPSPDYPKAVQYLDTYIALEPDKKDIDEIVAWKRTLEALDGALREHEKLAESFARLKQQHDRASKDRASLDKKISDLSAVIERQKKDLASLKETILKLDTVQQEIEKKKRGIKK